MNVYEHVFHATVFVWYHRKIRR